MKILHIINSLDVGGAEKLLLDTIPRYNKNKIKTDVLIFKSSNSPFLLQLKEKNCCNIIELKLDSVYSLLAIKKLSKYVKNYDIAHVHLFPALYFVALSKLLYRFKTKLIYTEHSTSNRRIRSRKFRMMDRFIYKMYSSVICITPKVKSVIKEYIKLPDKKLVVIHNGIDVDKFKNAKPISITDFKYNLDKDNKIIIQVSSFHEPKDQQILIKALPYLPNNVRLFLVGNGVDKKISEDLVLSLNLRKSVFFLGNRSDVPKLLKTANIIVLSSKYEGLSLSSIEAMASGRPFVASNVPGLKNIVEGAGVLFDQGNSKQLAQKITKLLQDKAHYKTVVKACQKRAEAYDISIMVKKHIKLYRETLS